MFSNLIKIYNVQKSLDSTIQPSNIQASSQKKAVLQVLFSLLSANDPILHKVGIFPSES